MIAMAVCFSVLVPLSLCNKESTRPLEEEKGIYPSDDNRVYLFHMFLSPFCRDQYRED